MDTYCVLRLSVRVLDNRSWNNCCVGAFIVVYLFLKLFELLILVFSSLSDMPIWDFVDIK